MKVNLSQVSSFDPRLGLEDSPDPRWWDDETGEVPPKRTGYGHQPLLSPTPDTTSGQRESIEDLFDAALAGFLPRNRELKPWEPDKLNPRHLQIINLKATGLSNKKIAEFLDVAEATVSVIVNHPDSQYLLARMLAYAAENVVDVETRIRASAPLAHEKLLDTLLTTKKEETIIKIGFGLLDRAGYGVTQKVESTQNVTVNVAKDDASLIAQAIRESKQVVEADYVILADEVGHPGSPASGGSEGGPSDSSDAEDSSMPSAGGSQDSNLRRTA